MPSPERALEDVLPLTPLQEGLLFHAGSDRDEDVYTVRTTIGLTGPLDPDRLRAAWAALLARYPNLRVGFWYEELERPVQFVARDAAVPVRFVDLSAAPPGEARAETARIEEAESRTPFDLTLAPPLRCVLVRHTPTEHTLVLTNHHIVLDGWSMPILVRELMEAYDADGDTGALPPAPAFRDHLAWLASRDTGAAEHAWTRALAGAPESTDVLGRPGARTTGPTENSGAQSRRVALTLTGDEAAALSSAPTRTGATVNSLVQAAWALVASRRTGRDDVVFGATVSGRSTGVAGAESMIGLLINTVPVRARLDPRESGADLARRIQDEQGALIEHQHLGLGRIQRAAGVWFDSLLVVENYPLDPELGERSFGGVGVREVDVHDATHYPLTLVALPGGEPEFVLGHRTDVCGEQQARDLLAEFRRTLMALVRAPESGPADLAPASDAETAALAGADRTFVAPGPSLLGDPPVESTVRADRVALVEAGSGAVLDHAQFRSRVNRLARVLVARGVGPGDVVAMGVPRSADLVVALHAVVVAGGAYLPLDLEYPPERLRFVLEDAAPRAVVTTREGAESLPDTVDAPLVLDAPNTAALLEQQPGTELEQHERRGTPNPDDLAYVIYTSGSTGRPKGVGVSHEAIVNRLEWMQYQFPIDGGDRVLQKTPSAFDVSVWEFFWPFRAGAALVVAPPGAHRDPARLAGLVQGHGVTTCHFVPSMLRAFLDDPSAAACDGLRRVFSSGEALPSGAAEQCFEVLPGTDLFNLYGPTEAAVDVTWFDAFEDVGRGTVPIGRPVWNTGVYVLDPFLRPVPDGVAGDLYLTGDQLARGYRGRPGLTAERFVADPFGRPGTRMYRTGDVARFRDGVLEFLGRSDSQVKVRGQRIEPGEIEAALTAVPGVTGAVATVAENASGEQVLVGHIGGDGSPDRVRAHISRTLPAHMVPSVLVAVEEWPLTPNGKLDRSALPEPDFGTRAGHGQRPRTDGERTICAAFTTVLGLAEVGTDDDFFRLGGDSISALRLVTEAAGGGVEISVHDVFSHPTPAGLAAVARRPDASAAGAEPPAGTETLVSLGADQMALLADLGRDPE
ncbi:non-ribosomal peptide synthetase [Nocardiopsis salina]|uniref:non-ribosomal peptide synthetase n=1 Tax=Nocardiopsis salina TaxID=245836 RepID=UPI0009FF2E89|nr:non-ribosomal peptide synthetase [Nocardiopsis salina]